MFKNFMIDFCFRLDSLQGYTKRYNTKIKIMLLRFMVLELLSNQQYPRL
jgi:hypothetical protein